MPKEWVLEQVPPLPLSCLLSYVGIVPDEGWPSGEYFTDGAGGSHSSWPALRRCGCGIVFLAASALLTPLFGAFFPLAGDPQTVPRAELFAILVVLLFLSPGAAATIHTDSELCSKGFLAQTDQGDNADLWQLLWSTILSKSLAIQVRRVKAHGLEHPEFMSMFALSPHQLLGNAIADKLADRAATAAAIDHEFASKILSLYAETQAIQRRFVSILGKIVKENFRESPLRPPQPEHLSLSYYAVRSNHKVTFANSRASCALCNLGAEGHRAVKLWLGTPCPGRDTNSEQCNQPDRPTRVCPKNLWVAGSLLHYSHDLYLYKGLAFCNNCGFVAGHSVRKLRQPCGQDLTEVPTQAGRANLKRLRAGLLPNNTPAWPADQAHFSQQPLLRLG